MSDPRFEAIAGCLLGGALGDAIGLPREGLSPGRAARLFPGSPLRHRFVLGRGMVSDDTEHALMTGQSLLAAGNDLDKFKKSLSWRLRAWLLGAPAGVGLATLRAILKMWIGFGPDRCGVRSAGNGPGMRAPVLGVCLGHDIEQMRAFVRASTRLTHTDLRAEEGAWLIARASHIASTETERPMDSDAILHEMASEVASAEWRAALDRVGSAIERGMSGDHFLEHMGWPRGVSGYVVPTVSACLFSWLSHPQEFQAAMETGVRMGGDADTVGAILGGIVGSGVGVSQLPSSWRKGLVEWPRTASWIESVSERLAAAFPVSASAPLGRPVKLFWPGLIPRNLFFLSIVLLHGFRRLLPPY